MPTLIGRRWIDRLKRTLRGRILLPVPPYGSVRYWEGCYRQVEPNDVFEWAGITYNDLMSYEYTLLPAYVGSTLHRGDRLRQQKQQQQRERAKTTLGESLNVYPRATVDEPVMMLGCGNSKIGEDMIEAGWRGPVVQVDVASRIVEAVSHRCTRFIEAGDMQFVQDDATQLSAFDRETVSACLDKGLLDALFCADEYGQCFDVIRAVHRVLKPGGVFCALSYSHPDYILDRLLFRGNDDGTVTRRIQTNDRSAVTDDGGARSAARMWQDIQIRQLDYVMLYRFQKGMSSSSSFDGFGSRQQNQYARRQRQHGRQHAQKRQQRRGRDRK